MLQNFHLLTHRPVELPMMRRGAHHQPFCYGRRKMKDYSKSPSAEVDVKFQLSRVALEATWRSMACISEQLSTPANRVAEGSMLLQWESWHLTSEL
ncbi:hypothetical protein V6N12_010351 [Hibiscus sabdariffa]|uniref:Uncharacterized protein n=1 Tax=Hibiscus sabdariffa TaxID=183260 RepID=A0ABR2EJU1_9ROSI